MTEKTLTTENIKPALDALRGELAPWPVVAMKQDKLNNTQKSAVNSGITSSLVAQIIANTAAIRALESAITGTGLRALVVSSLPAIGTQGILYIVPVTTYDPDTDADVVNYSNEYIWIPVEGGTASEGHYEQVGQTGIIINNGQLSITVNGVSVGTFTANQSGDTTAAITVPTNADYVDKTTAQTVAGVKTFSDGIVGNVTGNVTGNLTGTASKAIADEDGTSIKTGYGKLASTNVWSGVNYFNNENLYQTAANPRYAFKSSILEIGVQPSGHCTATVDWLDNNGVELGYSRFVEYNNSIQTYEVLLKNKAENGSLSPAGNDISASLQLALFKNGSSQLNLGTDTVAPTRNNSASLGSSSYQWSSVYADTYYYGTTSFTDKFVTTDTSQTINADKEFYYNKYLRVGGYRFSIKNSSYEKGVVPASNQWTAFNFVDKYNNPFFTVEYGNISNGRVVFKLTSSTNEADPSNIEFFTYQYKANDSNFISVSTDFIPKTTFTQDLGTSTNKWKTLNGVNPGALSLPDVSKAVSIDTTNWDKTGNLNSYTPPVDGWISIITDNASAANYIRCAYDNGDILAKANGNGYAQGLSVFMPVLKNTQLGIRLVCTTIGTAKLYPYLGNV